MGLDGSNYRKVRRAEAKTIGQMYGGGEGDRLCFSLQTCQGELSLSSPFSSPHLSPLCGAVYVFFWGGRIKERFKDVYRRMGTGPESRWKGQLLIHI